MTLIDFENLAVSITFWVGLLTMVAFLLQLGLKNDRLKAVGMAGMGIALVGSGATLVARGLIAQHAPWSNLWESMITVLFCSLIFYFIVEIWYKPRYFGVVAAPLIMLLIGGASILPAGFKGAAPLMPALQSYWIKVHVLIMLASYAAFTMSFAAAVAYFVVAWRGKRKGLSEAHTQAEAHTPKAEVVGGTAAASGDGPIPEFTATSAPLASVAVADAPAPSMPLAATAGPSAAFVEHEKQLAFFDELTYRLILMGFPLLMIGIITGAMWANGAWGTYWSWDPKETWALITWFVYAAYLHARISRDWTGHKAAGLACLGFASMIVTYIGVNYLSSGLHSYGFIR